MREFEPQFRYCDSFKDSLNASFSKIPIGNWNRYGSRARHDSSNFKNMRSKQRHYKNVYEKSLKKKKTVRYSNYDALKIAVFLIQREIIWEFEEL